jgi:hypothetical protein
MSVVQQNTVSKYVYPRRLVMIGVNCDFCNKRSSPDGAMVHQLSHIWLGYMRRQRL